MKRSLFLSVVFLFLAFGVKGSHIRAGEITAKRISNTSFSYEITLVVYTKGSSAIPIDSATISASDGWSSKAQFTSSINVGNDNIRTEYIFTHTFNVGQVVIKFRDENRVGGVLNMDNSTNTAFYIETMLVLDPLLGLNNTPELLVPPIDDGSTNQVYNYNPGAYDADGDSLSYEMNIPMSEDGIQVLNYKDPGQFFSAGAIQKMTLDSINGNLVWDMPSVAGIYNIAYRVLEWRRGIVIGYIHRDMQITIYDTDNQKPVLEIPNDTCIAANDMLLKIIKATDPDVDVLELDIFSGIVPPAIYTINDLTTTPEGIFTWTPTCADVRKAPYQVIFKTSDAPSVNPSLVDIKTWNITVNGPKVENVTISEVFNQTLGIQLNWNLYSCSNASKINIYRKECTSSMVENSCLETTLEQMGYELIFTTAINSTSYTDFEISNGQQYCYVLQAEFPLPKGGISYSSDEVCLVAGKTFPLLRKVSVVKTGVIDGEIEVLWEPPIDSNGFTLPFQYKLFRRAFNSTFYTELVLSASTSTTFIDKGINTQDLQYVYKVSLEGKESSEASSVFLSAEGLSRKIELQWSDSTPWTNFENFQYVYAYRLAQDTGLVLFDSVFAMTELEQKYSHINLQNGDTVCYRIKQISTYCNNKNLASQFNFSQEVCAVPIDETPPCPPNFNIDYDCEMINPYFNKLTFTPLVNPPFCIDDVIKYDIYFAEHEEDSLILFHSTSDTLFLHNRDNSIAGCYFIKAADESGNISEASELICIDNCPRFVLPNIFTPNGDAFNDFFTPILPTKFVKSLDFKIYNRWGRILFQTNDININWNGIGENGKIIPDGVYYYSAEVEFYRLKKSDEIQKLKGWIQILH